MDNCTGDIQATLAMGIVQVGTIGGLALVAAFVFEQPRLPQTGPQWLMVAILVIVCTGFGFTLQPVAQSHVTVERVGLFCAIKSGHRGFAGRCCAA